jgi:hypothetical protein
LTDLLHEAGKLMAHNGSRLNNLAMQVSMDVRTANAASFHLDQYLPRSHNGFGFLQDGELFHA